MNNVAPDATMVICLHKNLQRKGFFFFVCFRTFLVHRLSSDRIKNAPGALRLVVLLYKCYLFFVITVCCCLLLFNLCRQICMYAVLYTTHRHAYAIRIISKTKPISNWWIKSRSVNVECCLLHAYFRICERITYII